MTGGSTGPTKPPAPSTVIGYCGQAAPGRPRHGRAGQSPGWDPVEDPGSCLQAWSAGLPGLSLPSRAAGRTPASSAPMESACSPAPAQNCTLLDPACSRLGPEKPLPATPPRATVPTSGWCFQQLGVGVAPAGARGSVCGKELCGSRGCCRPGCENQRFWRQAGLTGPVTVTFPGAAPQLLGGVGLVD